MSGRLVNAGGRILGTTGIKAGTVGTNGCTCCCSCADTGFDAPGCNHLTTPTSFLITDSGITSPCGAACLAVSTAPLYRDFVVDSGLGATNCLTGVGGVWNSGAVASGTETVYLDAACATLVQTNVLDMQWFLTRTSGHWRLILESVPDPDNVRFVAFDGTIATADPVSCCKALTFTNSILTCHDGSSDPAFGPYGALMIGRGGTVVATPCCP